MSRGRSFSVVTASVAWVGVIALLAFALLQVSSVAARFFGGAITGSAEIALIFVVTMVAAALVTATAHGAHPAVHLVTERVSPAARRVLARGAGILSLAFWIALAAAAIWITEGNARVSEVTEILNISLIPIRIVWIVALLLVCVLLARALRHRPEGDERSPP